MAGLLPKPVSLSASDVLRSVFCPQQVLPLCWDQAAAAWCCGLLWGRPPSPCHCLFCFPTLRVNVLTLGSNSEKFPLPSEVMDSHILSTSLAESQIFSHSNLYLSVFHIAMKAVFHRIAIFSP